MILPVKLNLLNVPRNYRPSSEVQSSILRFVGEVLGDKLKEVGLEFIKVEYAGRLNQNGRHLKQSNLRQRSRRLETASVPLKVTVRGPTDISDMSLSYIMEIIRENFNELIDYLQQNGNSLDANYASYDIVCCGNGKTENIFYHVDLSAGDYDFGDLLTGEIVTEMPTSRPTPRPTLGPTPEVVNNVGTMSNSDSDTVTILPWWVWLIIILILLLLVICCICFCLRRRRAEKETKQEKNEQAINIWMQKGGSVADDHSETEYSKSRVQRRSRGPPPLRSTVGWRGDGQSRASRPPPPSRPRIKRALSQAELSEERRLQRDPTEYYEAREPTKNSEAREPTEYISSAIALKEPTEYISSAIASKDPDNGDIGSTAVSMDPPEENALVSYNNRHQYHDTNSHLSEEPEGTKESKKASMYAADVYYNNNTPIVSDAEDGNKMEPRGKKVPKKDSMFVCDLDQLPEDVRARSSGRSRADRSDRAAADSKNRSDADGKRKKRKKKKRNATERLRSSLTRGSRRPQHPTEDEDETNS